MRYQMVIENVSVPLIEDKMKEVCVIGFSKVYKRLQLVVVRENDGIQTTIKRR